MLQKILQWGISVEFRVRMELWYSKENKKSHSCRHPQICISRHWGVLAHSIPPFVSLLLPSAIMQRIIEPLDACCC